jgi:sulfur carrier protein ThiS
LGVSGLCQGVSVGVEVGDYFVYDYSIEVDGEFYFLLNWGDFDAYDFYQAWNITDWKRREVTAVNGAVITFNVTTGYVNGTETNEVVDFNMTSSHDFWAIGAEMDAGEQAGTLADLDPLYIDETVQLDYEEETRDTNTASWADTDIVSWRSMWWDKQTGGLVKELVEFSTTNLENITESLTINARHVLVDTNRWVVPEFPSGTAMALAFVAVTVCVQVYRRRKLPK